MTEADDFVKSAHVIKHDIVQLRRILADLRTEGTYACREPLRQQHTDDHVGGHQQQGEPRVERERGDREHHRRHHGDYDRGNRVREENLKQFDIRGDQGNQIALAFSCQFGRSELA